MSIIEQGLREAGLKLADNNALPKGQRGVKDFQRAIAAIRAAEGSMLSQLSEAERARNDAQSKVIELQDRVRILEAENLKHRLKARVGEIESLTTSERTKLIELSAK